LRFSKKISQPSSFINKNNTPLKMISNLAQDIYNVTGTFISPIKQDRASFKSAKIPMTEGPNSLPPSVLDGSPIP
jgi:hypothetical protein